MIEFILGIILLLIGLTFFCFIVYIMLNSKIDENEDVPTEQELQDLKSEFQTCEQLLKEYESKDKIAK